ADEDSVYAFDMHLYLSAVGVAAIGFRQRVVGQIGFEIGGESPPVEDGSNLQMLRPRRAETERRSDGVLRTGDIDAVDIRLRIDHGLVLRRVVLRLRRRGYQHQGESERAEPHDRARRRCKHRNEAPSHPAEHSCPTAHDVPPARNHLEDCPAAGFAIGACRTRPKSRRLSERLVANTGAPSPAPGLARCRLPDAVRVADGGGAARSGIARPVSGRIEDRRAGDAIARAAGN
ncbi:hypothetical protein QU38_02875, partial [Staphylococcus aureus]